MNQREMGGPQRDYAMITEQGRGGEGGEPMSAEKKNERDMKKHKKHKRERELEKKAQVITDR